MHKYKAGLLKPSRDAGKFEEFWSACRQHEIPYGECCPQPVRNTLKKSRQIHLGKSL
jgi:hypothetical protein